MASGQRKRQLERERAEEAKREERSRRLNVRDEIHFLAGIQRETSGRLAELQKGAAPEYEGEAEHCWEVLALVLEDMRLTEQQYMELCRFPEVAI
jgi:hypothetical protein